MPERPGGAPFVNALPASVIERYEREHPEQHTAAQEPEKAVCRGTGYLPRSVGELLPDGRRTGLCIWCEQFHPMDEVIPPSKPEWPREFRLAEHQESPPTQR